MMGYFEESKSYKLFDPIKQQIIIKRNVIFDEKILGIKLLNSSSSILHSEPFDIVADNGSTIPSFSILISQSTSSLELIGIQDTQKL